MTVFDSNTGMKLNGRETKHTRTTPAKMPTFVQWYCATNGVSSEDSEAIKTGRADQGVQDSYQDFRKEFSPTAAGLQAEAQNAGLVLQSVSRSQHKGGDKDGATRRISLIFAEPPKGRSAGSKTKKDLEKERDELKAVIDDAIKEKSDLDEDFKI